VRETTAEIWIGPDQLSGWTGTERGINATHLMLLRENSRPAWLLLPGNLYDSQPPTIGPAKVWIPTLLNPVQDALLFFSVIGAKIPEVCVALDQLEKSRSRGRFDLLDTFPTGVPSELYSVVQRHLVGLRVVVSVGAQSLANKDLSALTEYHGLSIDIRTSIKKLN
jgi:hypothetical protein